MAEELGNFDITVGADEDQIAKAHEAGGKAAAEAIVAAANDIASSIAKAITEAVDNATSRTVSQSSQAAGTAVSAGSGAAGRVGAQIDAQKRRTADAASTAATRARALTSYRSDRSSASRAGKAALLRGAGAARGGVVAAGAAAAGGAAAALGGPVGITLLAVAAAATLVVVTLKKFVDVVRGLIDRIVSDRNRLAQVNPVVAKAMAIGTVGNIRRMITEGQARSRAILETTLALERLKNAAQPLVLMIKKIVDSISLKLIKSLEWLANIATIVGGILLRLVQDASEAIAQWMADLYMTGHFPKWVGSLALKLLDIRNEIYRIRKELADARSQGVNDVNTLMIEDLNSLSGGRAFPFAPLGIGVDVYGKDYERHR